MENVLDGAEIVSAENEITENATQPLAKEEEMGHTAKEGEGGEEGYRGTESEDTAPTESPIDYGAIAQSDVAALKAEFPELAGVNSITELDNPLRYAALRDLGLSPSEAYLATAKRVARDTRAHLKSALGKGASPSETTMTHRELAMARELFPGKNDAELHSLYKRVRN
jgi:hypothetical protein